ncbi:type VI secretion system baseplate subunit TssG [Edwardsiella piscicida]|uniref:type VI secretion system baseplate subunit TssG n=1 Tax=Edwardsiella piscicida TaxID=1263550 RepID=UPI00069234D2|nr:type VI secretion system baseplate subunit TssG [Edwardsiella piscicida]ELM3657158.1 type VI secretion system baseplate subunit TssG [Edwardsiella piscicida]QBB13359.1 type VI secretion system baseplate subunit TssG [Edwardsiella piscicida]UCQ36918.1 type VI secretion system baseplate subunit TssG [Edwardsiella piscicida]
MNDALSPKSMLEQLYARPYEFDFFQAVRILELQQLRCGCQELPLRFRTHLSLVTPASSVYALQPPAADQPQVMTINFMGLTGPSGALPTRYTEMLLARRLQHRDQTAHHFFDLLNHRLITLFYQAWRKHQATADLECGLQADWRQMLLSLAGLGTLGLQNRLKKDGVNDDVFAYYAGRFGTRSLSEEGLRTLLTDYFSVPVEILPFQGRWLKLDEADLLTLGRQNCTLGEWPVLGRQVWDAQSQFRIRLGPMSYQQFQPFLPGGKDFRALTKLVRFAIEIAVTFDIQLVLAASEVPPCTLGDSQAGAARPGWIGWLGGRPARLGDADEVVLQASESGKPAR